MTQWEDVLAYQARQPEFTSEQIAWLQEGLSRGYWEGYTNSEVPIEVLVQKAQGGDSTPDRPLEFFDDPSDDIQLPDGPVHGTLHVPDSTPERESGA